MVRINKNTLLILVGFTFGCFLAYLGYPITTWQYWGVMCFVIALMGLS
jgi:hypothetical protein